MGEIENINHKTFISQLSTDYSAPNIQDLQSQVWKINAPQKLKHFIWQAVSGQLAVKANLERRGIPCDRRCDRCGAEDETINHVLFECPPAIQAWALSRIPAGPSFPGSSIYANIDHLLWRLPKKEEYISFPWLLWFLWKARNEKVFNARNTDTRELILAAESEAEAWRISQKGSDRKSGCYGEIRHLQKEKIFRPLTMDPSFTGYRCMVDASWKEDDLFTGIGWFGFPFETGGTILGAQCIRRSLSPLHVEFEALLWAMTCLSTLQLTEVEFLVDCSKLVKIVEDPSAWPAFLPYLDDLSRLQSCFTSFFLGQIPRALNHKADCLARNVRGFSRSQSFVNNVPNLWSRYCSTPQAFAADPRFIHFSSCLFKLGYMRVLLNCIAFAVCFSNKTLFSLLYFFSFCCDAVDGWCARKFNQVSTFGAVLDMVTDRVSTACLLVILSQIYRYSLLEHLNSSISTFLSSKTSHKDVKDSTSWLFKLYYGDRMFMGYCCVSCEVLYIILLLIAKNQTENLMTVVVESLTQISLLSVLVTSSIFGWSIKLLEQRNETEKKDEEERVR